MKKKRSYAWTWLQSNRQEEVAPAPLASKERLKLIQSLIRKDVK